MNRKKFLSLLKSYGVENDIPNISEANASFLREILLKKSVKSLLEIGTANGYSTIQFWDILELQNGHIHTIEFSLNSYNEAQKNFQEAELSHCITQHYGDARMIIPQIQESFDFVFIDGLKKASRHFLELVWEKVPSGGTIVIDDVIKFRHKMEDLYRYLEEKKIPYMILHIDPDDGIMLIEK